VEKTKENEELLKNRIFSCFSGSINEPDRQQTFLGQLSGLTYNWCRDYLNFDINNLGVEIVEITKRLLDENSKANIPKDKEGFLKYLITSLKNGKKEYLRIYEKRNQDDLIRMKERYLGRKLTEDEKISSVNKWYDFENAMKVNGSSLTGTIKEESPHADYLNSEDTAIILEAIKTVLSGKQERSRDCYRALLTLCCIDNVALYPVLDSQIIEACRQRAEKPKQYEIYQMYHPNASKSGSEAMASKNLKELLSDLETYLKEKNPEIF